MMQVMQTITYTLMAIRSQTNAWLLSLTTASFLHVMHLSLATSRSQLTNSMSPTSSIRFGLFIVIQTYCLFPSQHCGLLQVRAAALYKKILVHSCTEMADNSFVNILCVFVYHMYIRYHINLVFYVQNCRYCRNFSSFRTILDHLISDKCVVM